MRFLVLFALCLWPVAALSDDLVPQVAVTGTGTVSAEPDMATVFLGVSREGRTASAAMAAASEAAAQVLETVSQAGVEPRDVQTSSINLSPVWEQSNARPRQIRAYVASYDMQVRLREIGKTGDFLDAIVDDGANRLNGLSFGLADRTPLEQEARAAAMRAAKDKAETLAAAAEVRLGPVLSIVEGGAFRPQPAFREATLDAASAVATGEVDVRVSVSVTYGIEQ